MNQRALYRRPFRHVPLSDNDHVHRYLKAGKRVAKPNHLYSPVRNVLLDYQEIEIAAVARITPRMRTEPAAGLVLFAVNDRLAGLLVMLGGGGVIFFGGFAVAYRRDRSRGVLTVLALHAANFFGDFLSP